MLAVEYHTTGSIQIIADVLYLSRNRLRPVDVPIIVVDFGYPDAGTIDDGVEIGIQASRIGKFKHSDVSIIHVYITSCGQTNICGQRGRGR